MPVPGIAELETPSLSPTACPACRGFVAESHQCDRCGRIFPLVAGMADFRLAPDRYLSLADERSKAERLAELADSLDLTELARAYYARTSDVDANRRNRFLAHIASAEDRGRALAALLPAQGRTLEVGCGTGGLLVAAAEQNHDIVGVDIAARWLVLARKRLESCGFEKIPLWVADAARLPWPDQSFDTVVADSLIEHLDDPQAAIAEWLRVVRPGGRLILWSPNRFSVLTDPHVGIWGLGFLPRSAQVRWVKLRRGCGWSIQPRTAREVARMVQKAGWKQVRTTPAQVLGSGICHQLYHRAISHSLPREFLRRFGPLWQLVAEKGANR